MADRKKKKKKVDKAVKRVRKRNPSLGTMSKGMVGLKRAMQKGKKKKKK